MSLAPRRTSAVVLTVAVVAAAAGCGGQSRAGGGSSTAPTSAGSSPAPLVGTITVFAAASLTGSFTALGKSFEAVHPGTTVRFEFGASSTLAQQILAGAPADVFASAAATNMKQVAADVEPPTNFAANSAEIAVAPAASSRVTSITALGAPGVSVAVCQPQVPCGALAVAVLAKAHVSVTPRTQGLDVKSTLAYVTNGQVDAAIVYRTDVQAAGAKVVAVQVPAADNASTEYPIATVRASHDAALAAAFTAYVTSAAGRSVLAAAGFSAP